MEIRVLRYFLAVAREQSISAAAEALHLSQPTLSTQLKALEEELGKKLLIRGTSGTRKVTLTEEGRILRKRAEEILSLVRRTEDEIALSSQVIAGDVYIGAGETDGVRLLTQAARQVQAEHPHVHFHISSGDGKDVLEDLDKGLIDFGLLLQTVDISKYEFIRMPVKEEWGVLTREDSPLGGLKSVRPENLAGRPLMISGRELIENELANWFGGGLDGLDIPVRYNLLYNVAMLVKNGFGDALCIRLDCSYPGLRFIPLSPPLELGSVLVWKRHQVTSSAVEALIVHARKCFSSISHDVK